jgi:hypothetical protein
MVAGLQQYFTQTADINGNYNTCSTLLVHSLFMGKYMLVNAASFHNKE